MIAADRDQTNGHIGCQQAQNHDSPRDPGTADRPASAERAGVARESHAEFPLAMTLTSMKFRKVCPIVSQSYFVATAWRPLRLNEPLRSLSLKIRNTAAANSAGRSAIRISRPETKSSPSAPLEVATTGVPRASDSRIFTRVPP